MTTEIRVLIVDDEPLAREGIRLLLKQEPGFSVVGESSDGVSAADAIKRLKPDLVFLDIQMPGMSGFELLAKLPPKELPMVIFVSAYDRYAIKAFDIHAMDYLLKPVDTARFHEACQRAKRLVKERHTQEFNERLVAMLNSLRTASEPPVAHSDYLTRFAVKDGERVYFVAADEVDWIGAANYYAELHSGKKLHLLREALNTLQTKLDPRHFLRIHRSTIVNISRIREVRRGFGSDYLVVLTDGTQLKSGRSYRPQLDRLLSGS